MASTSRSPRKKRYTMDVTVNLRVQVCAEVTVSAERAQEAYAAALQRAAQQHPLIAAYLDESLDHRGGTHTLEIISVARGRRGARTQGASQRGSRTDATRPR